MISVSVHGTEELTRRLLEIGSDAPAAATRAINKTLRSGATATRRTLVADTGLQGRAIDRSLDQRRAVYRDLRGTLSVGPYRDARGRSGPGGRIPLVEFRARGPEPSRGRGRGVRYTLPGGRGSAPHAFIVTLRSGHRGVFQRIRPTRSRRGLPPGTPALPIDQLYGPSLYRVMRQMGLRLVLPEMQAAFERNLAHEIDWILQQRAQAGEE